MKITDPGVVNGGSVELAPAQAFPQHGIDLPDIAFGAQTTLAYAENSANTGMLTVSDGRHAATIALLGNYIYPKDFGQRARTIPAQDQRDRPQSKKPRGMIVSSLERSSRGHGGSRLISSSCGSCCAINEG